MSIDGDFIEGVHFYFNENNYMVFTQKYHLQRGYCCGIALSIIKMYLNRQEENY
jgi:hypothetical protein